MTRVPQPAGTRGSLKWIQRAVAACQHELEEPILARTGGSTIDWRSPIASDDHAEYRDSSFLGVLGLAEHCEALSDFWPSRGPQWDALGVTDSGAVLLVEAKAHVDEMCSSGTQASSTSRSRIAARLNALADALGARSDRADWTNHFYQLANRLAHLNFLRRRDVPA